MSSLPESAFYPLHTPAAQVIRDGAEALAVARHVAAVLGEQDAERDRSRQVPVELLDLYSNSGLWGISVPREYGGAQVSYAVLAEVIAIISAADPSLGQIPQNHYCLLEDIRLQGTPGAAGALFRPGPARPALCQCAVGNRRQERAGHPGHGTAQW